MEKWTKYLMLFLISLSFNLSEKLLASESLGAKVTLKNGATISKELFEKEWSKILGLLSSETVQGPLEYYELVQKAKNPLYIITEGFSQGLAKLGLLVDGRVPQHVKDIVLSSSSGEWTEMKIEDPLLPVASQESQLSCSALFKFI